MMLKFGFLLDCIERAGLEDLLKSALDAYMSVQAIPVEEWKSAC